MPDFSRPEYASYMQLCRELRLERKLREGDWVRVWRKRQGPPDGSECHPSWLESTDQIYVVGEGRQGLNSYVPSAPYQATEWSELNLIWVPALGDWLEMLEAVYKMAEDESPAVTHARILRALADEIIRAAFDGPIEEAAARLWIAVKKG